MFLVNSLLYSFQSESSLRVPLMDVDMGSSPNLIPSPQMILSPQTPPTPNGSLFDSPLATPSPGTSNDSSQMLVDSENFILNHLQLLQQQKQLEQQQKLEQKKQQQQQKMLQEQKRLQQQQQQQLQQQQKLKKQDQLKQLLQNEDVQKLILGNQNAASIIDMLSKNLLGQQTQMLAETQSQTVVSSNVPVTSNSLLMGIMNAPSPTATTSKETVSNTPKPKTINSNRNLSILEALNADESQSARNKSSSAKAGNVTQNIKQTSTPTLSHQLGVKKDTMGFTIPAVSINI